MALGSYLTEPAFTGANPPNLAISDWIIFGYGFNPFSLLPSLAYIGNLLRCELTHWVKFTKVHRGSFIAYPSFFKSVSHIVLMTSQKQVQRVAARTIVAGVANAHAFWYIASNKLKSYTMRVGALVSDFASSVAGLTVEAFGPVPALLKPSNVNVLKESVLKRRLLRPFTDRPFHSPLNSVLVCFHVPILTLVTTLAQG